MSSKEESVDVKKCPYCGEEILTVAIKCKHCGEWLKKEVSRVGTHSPHEKGSADARAVSKGIKQQKEEETVSNFLYGVAIVFGVVVGYSVHNDTIVGIVINGWWVGLIVALGLGFAINSWYMRE